jgi:hypothetical protein
MFNYSEYTTNDNGNQIFFGGKAIGSNFGPDEVKNMFSENSSAQRFTRFSSSLINYDYKTGHYIGNWDAQYPFLLTSFIEVARGIRKPSWFLSDQYIDLFKNCYAKFNSTFSSHSNLKLVGSDN